VGKIWSVALVALLLYGCAGQAPVRRDEGVTEPAAGPGQPATTTETPPAPEPTTQPEAAPQPMPTPPPEVLPQPAPAPPPKAVPTPVPAPKPVPPPQPAPVPKAAPAPKPAPTPKPAVPPKPAPVPAPVPESGQAASEAVPTVDLEKLPLALNSNWTLDMGRDPVSGRQRCFLESKTLRIDDGQGGSEISLVFTQDTLRVHTRSNVDMSYDGTGLRVDAEPPFPLQRLFRETDVVFSEKINDIMRQFRNGTSATVTLGFWPTWPVTQAYSARFAIDGYAAASSALQACDKLLP
jgi:hypothetical protein